MASVLATEVVGSTARAVPGEQVAPMSAACIERIIDAAASGMSARAIGRLEDIPHPRILRLLKRPESREAIRAIRRRELAAERQREQRRRDAELAAAGTPRPVGPPRASWQAGRVTKPGRADLYLDKLGRWRRVAVAGSDPLATASDFHRRGTTAPPDLAAEYGFGPPGYDRPPLGYVPPDDRPVRMRPPRGTRERDVLEQVSPIPAGEVPARLAEGWELAAAAS